MKAYKYLKDIFGESFNKVKYKIFLLQFLSIVLETLSIAIIIPIISGFIDPSISSKTIFFLEKYLNIGLDAIELSFFLYAILIIFIIKSLLLSIVSWHQIKILIDLQKKLSLNLLNGYLRSSYGFISKRNSAVYIRNIFEETGQATARLTNYINMITEIFIFFAISLILVIYDIKASLIIIIFFLLIIAFYFFGIKNYLINLGNIRLINESLKLKTLSEIFKSWKMIKLSQKESFFVNIYDKYNSLNLNAIRKNAFISTLTRYWAEVVLILGVILFYNVLNILGDTEKKILVKISVLFVLSLRLFPSINRITGYIQKIKFLDESFKKIVEDIEQFKNNKFFEKSKNSQRDNLFNFKSILNINNLNFKYDKNEQKIIENLKLDISSNEIVGIFGKTGSGKSTLVDLISGFNRPNSGEINLGDADIYNDIGQWQLNLGYVPQTIFLVDESIKFNIALESDNSKIDELRLNKAIEVSQLNEFVKSLNLKSDTSIGEDGSRLSGGQKQRIGIARALYREPKILILDEATSGIDNTTRKKLFNSIRNNYIDTRIIIISHNLNDYDFCDKIYEIVNGKLENSVKNV